MRLKKRLIWCFLWLEPKIFNDFGPIMLKIGDKTNQIREILKNTQRGELRRAPIERASKITSIGEIPGFCRYNSPRIEGVPDFFGLRALALHLWKYFYQARIIQSNK